MQDPCDSASKAQECPSRAFVVASSDGIVESIEIALVRVNRDEHPTNSLGLIVDEVRQAGGDLRGKVFVGE